MCSLKQMGRVVLYYLEEARIFLMLKLCLQLSQLDSVLPAIILAAEELTEWSWKILVGDTECSSTQGPLHAVAMYYRSGQWPCQYHL